ncbi:ribosomal protein L7/L12 [Kitasatospora sp. NPDC088391]|uniref:ribosomal protein L7/L12 n=1 Tax=Kitasatospora sp. NPDC088391 TaxID=3364074 RepID=UPI0038289BF0
MSEDPEFAVLVASVGERRIEVDKVVRAAAGLSVWEAGRWLVELPAELPGSRPFGEARRVVAELRAAGATAGLRCGWCARAVDPGAPVDPGPCAEQRWLSAPCPASF